MPSPGTTKSSQRDVDQVVAGLAADGAAEDRVVPVHRERRLVQEQVAVLAQRVAEPAAGELPLGLRLVHQVGERHAGAQRLVDARRAGQQRLAVDLRRPVVVPLLRPGDATERQLHADHEVEPAAYDGPHPLDERQVAPQQPVVPDAHREVGRHVGLAAGVLDLAADDLHRPGAVVALGARGTSRRPPRRPRPAADQHRHRGLDVVPDVDVLARPSTGTAPSGSCMAAIDAAVCATCALESTPATDGIGVGAAGCHGAVVSGLRR